MPKLTDPTLITANIIARNMSNTALEYRNVGDVHVTVQGSTSKEMIDEFAHKLSSAITNIVPKYAPV